jgi:hypothetical protein
MIQQGLAGRVDKCFAEERNTLNLYTDSKFHEISTLFYGTHVRYSKVHGHVVGFAQLALRRARKSDIVISTQGNLLILSRNESWAVLHMDRSTKILVRQLQRVYEYYGVLSSKAEVKKH